MAIDRRRFSEGMLAAFAAAATGPPAPAIASTLVDRSAYRGPNVIAVRFGGGVRRRETIEAATSFAPFLRNSLIPNGVLVSNMSIAQLQGVDTSHAEGTLNILTGRYLAYRDNSGQLFDDRLQPTAPTLFEYLRKAYGLKTHEALLVNGEDRKGEETFTYGFHKHYGADYRAEVLSLYQYKKFIYPKLLAEGLGTDEELAAIREQLSSLTSGGTPQATAVAPEIETFWQSWRQDYGTTGLVNPRGDRALTELALRALAKLRPRLMMINYQDPDYVHWGNASHYTRAIAIIDEGLQRLVAAVAADEHYRERTVFVVVPDCGRDANPLMGVPFQHHFNTRSAHEIFAVLYGAGILRGRLIDRPTDQTAIAPTIAALMGFRAAEAEGEMLGEALT